MTGAGPRAPMLWADGVERPAIGGLSPRELQRFSDRRGLGLSAGELRRIQQYFRREGREPSDVELAGLAQSWSEHCSYKSSRRFLRESFGRLPRSARVLGTGDAGVLRYEPGWAYALRIESHNHPSAVEPYGGAATGIGGILRDVLAVGAKPIALADPLFFGPRDTPAESVPHGVKSPRYLLSEVVAGIRDYGNRVGVPTVAGAIQFDPSYTVNPLVNVGCLGVLPVRRLRPNRAQAAGDLLILAGGRTGRDGIGGVAFASQELTERSEEASRSSVQLGNPIMKEPLIHACLDAFDHGLVRSVKDLGGGGLATASGELCGAGGFGMEVELSEVPLRDPDLRPWEVWISESQERMILECRPADSARLLRTFERHDVPANPIGRVVRGHRERVFAGGGLAADLDLAFRVDPPVLRRPTRSPRPARRPSPSLRHEDAAALFRELLLSPDSVSREPVLRVYDHEVQGRTVLKPMHGDVAHPSHGDAAVLRPRPESWKGIALAIGAQPWAVAADPRGGARWTAEEAARNLYAVGAVPDAFTDCLNFGNPEDPRVLGSFAAAVAGLASAARALGVAVPSGNVSLYNGGLGREILPSPVLLATGVVGDLRRAVTSDLKAEGDRLFLVGRSAPQLGGSLLARRRGWRGLAIPPTDPRALRGIGEKIVAAGRGGEIVAAHDVSDGGLAVCLAEMAFGGGLGFDVNLAATGLADPAIALAAEGASRFVVEVPDSSARSFARRLGREAVALGRVTESRGVWNFGGRSSAAIDLGELYGLWRAGLDRP